jgi:hypothetical protein
MRNGKRRVTEEKLNTAADSAAPSSVQLAGAKNASSFFGKGYGAFFLYDFDFRVIRSIFGQNGFFLLT